MSNDDAIRLWTVYLSDDCLYGSVRYRGAVLRRGDRSTFAILRCRPSEVSAHVPGGFIAVEKAEE